MIGTRIAAISNVGAEFPPILIGPTESDLLRDPEVSEPADCSIPDPQHSEEKNLNPSYTSWFCSSVKPRMHTPAIGRSSSLYLTLFSSPDVTQREVFEDVVPTRLQQARALIDSGDLEGAKQALGAAKQDIKAYTRTHPDEPITAPLAKLFGTIQLYQGEVWDRLPTENGTHAGAIRSYQSALKMADTAMALDPSDPESFLIHSEVRHLLSDYRLAMEDLIAAARLDPSQKSALENYRCRLAELGDRFAGQRQKAQLSDDTPKVMLLLIEELKIAEALRDSEQAAMPSPFNPDLGADRAATNERWQAHQRRVEALSTLLANYTSRQALADALAPLQELASQGYLTPENLGAYVERNWVTFSCAPSGGTQIHLTPDFQRLGGPEQGMALQEMQRIGMRAQLQSAFEGETDNHRRLYYQAKLHLMDGNLPASRIAMMDFKTATYGTEDPEILMMREEIRGILRHFSLAATERLLEAADSLGTQRANSWLGLERDIAKRTGPITERMLHAMRTFLQQGKADTLDEAMVTLHAERGRLWAEFFRNGGVVRDDWVVTLPPRRLRYGSEERVAEQRAAREFLAAFRQDPHATHPDILSLRLEGGALVAPGQSTHNNREVIRVAVGREGGTIRVQDASSRIWIFPPSDHERVVVIHKNDVWSPHFRGHSELYEAAFGALSGSRDAGEVAGDYTRGHPNTLDELATRLGELGTNQRSVLSDPDFENLIECEMRVGMERMQTAGARQQELLTLAESLRHRAGSYALTGEILEGLFAAEMERAMGEIPQADVDRIRTEIAADRGAVVREVQESLDHMSASDSAAFRRRFPSGAPTREEFDRMVAEAMTLKATIQMRKLAMYRIDARYESGELDKDSIAGRAWHIYDDMKDPLDKTWNLSDETWDTITGEIVLTAVTMPLTMGIGSIVRTGLGSTSLALRFAARGGYSYLATRGLIFTAGSTVEGLLMEGTKAAILGTDFEMRNVGWNILMSGAFHAGSRLWGRGAERIGLGEQAIQNASGASRWGRAGGNFFGTMATQTAVAGTLGEIELLLSGRESPHTFWERWRGHAARMVAFHYGTKAINVVSGNLAQDAERRSRLRMRTAYESGLEPISPSSKDYSHLQPGSLAEVPISDIIPTQGAVFLQGEGGKKGVLEYATAEQVAELPQVRILDGRMYVAEGHHRLMLELIKREPMVKVEVVGPTAEEITWGLKPTLQERATTWNAIQWRSGSGTEVMPSKMAREKVLDAYKNTLHKNPTSNRQK